ncbi:MAG: hypothetical protein HDT44_09760 [Ruminococcaceae bacterium]|nr:hypothetical protein [Oscillospiraceae bacterium]
MFKYRNVMIASYTLFFFSTMVHLINSCLTLPKNEIIFSMICGGVLFAVPLIFTIIGKIKRAQPYVLVTFFAVSCLALSVINQSAFYLPVLFAAAVVMCGFFLSSKLSLYYLLLTDVILIVNVIFFMPDHIDHLTSVYLLICVCYNLSGLGMVLFVQSVRTNFFFLRKKNKQLSVSGRKNDEFWAASSEQMNSIAGKLSEACDALLARNDLPAPVRETLFKIHSETGRLSIALNDAEDYALTESGSMALNIAPYSVHSLVSDVANFCFSACSNPDLDIIINCQPEIPAVLIGDSRRITQVIMNLFTNSVKYTKKGSVTISLRARKTADGVNLHIEVTDTGLGIAPDAANRIFTVYADSDGEKPVIHLGLGVAKRLVSLMDGFIFVRNVKTGGSRFSVTIPQKVENHLPFAEVPDPENIKALLYLRSPVIAAACLSQLKKMGVKCSVCRSRADFILKKDDPEITHIFFDYGFYPFDKPIFDIMARVKTVVAVCGDGETETPIPRNIKRVLKPLAITVFSHIFNNGSVGGQGFVQEFIAPDAKVLVVGENGAVLKGLEAYRIEPDRTNIKDIIKRLEETDYDLVFLCGSGNESAAARIMAADDGMFTNIPVIEVGEIIGGCSDRLPLDFTPAQLDAVLSKWLDEELLKPIADNDSSRYEELDPVRGMAVAGGSRSAYRDMLEIFEDRARNSFPTLAKLVENSSFEQCTIVLQSIRSVSSSIGAVSAAEIARQGSAAAERKEQAVLKELNDVLNIKIIRLLSDISKYFADVGIREISEEELLQRTERTKAQLAEEKPEIAAEIIKELLEMHIGYRARTILKSALNEINAGSTERSIIDLNRLKKGQDNESGEEEQ